MTRVSPGIPRGLWGSRVWGKRLDGSPAGRQEEPWRMCSLRSGWQPPGEGGQASGAQLSPSVNARKPQWISSYLLNQSLENMRCREPEPPEISYPASPPAEEETEGQRVMSVGPRLFHLLTHRKVPWPVSASLFHPSFFLLINLCSSSTFGFSWKRHWSLGALWTQRAPGNVSDVPSTVLSHHCCHQHHHHHRHQEATAWRSTQTILHEDVQMASRYMKTYSVSLIIREMQSNYIKLSPLQWSQGPSPTSTMLWGCGEKGTLLHCWWECKLVQPLSKAIWSFLKQLKIELPYDLAIPLLDIFLQKKLKL